MTLQPGRFAFIKQVSIILTLETAKAWALRHCQISSVKISFELNFTRLSNTTLLTNKAPFQAPLKRSNSNKGRGKQIPPIMDPSLIKPEISPAKMNSELALNFFGEDLVPGGEMMSPAQMLPPQPMGPPMSIPPPALTSPVNHHPNNMPPHMNHMLNQQKPSYSIQMKPPMKTHNPQLDPLMHKRYVLSEEVSC